MTSIKCKLICYTRWGYPCNHSTHQSISDAIKEARELLDDDYAFSYDIFSEDGKKLLKRGFK